MDNRNKTQQKTHEIIQKDITVTKLNYQKLSLIHAILEWASCSGLALGHDPKQRGTVLEAYFSKKIDDIRRARPTADLPAPVTVNIVVTSVMYDHGSLTHR